PRPLRFQPVLAERPDDGTEVGNGSHGLRIRPQPQGDGRFRFWVTLLSHDAPPLDRKDSFSPLPLKRKPCRSRGLSERSLKECNPKDLGVRRGQDYGNRG